MGFANLASDIKGFIDNATSLDKGNATPYPERYKSVSNTFEKKNWSESLGYGFKVVRVKDGTPVDAGDDWKEFILQINPQDLTQDEIFAIEVTPTFSGVLVEHQGTTLKDINISGTTGVSPKRKDAGANPLDGRPIFSAGRSGFAEFQELRSYFRAYVEQKRRDPNASDGELRLVWQNFRDSEYLYVEPQKFTMRRSAGKPMMYDYTIALKAIGIAKGEPAGSFGSDLDAAIKLTGDTIDYLVKIAEGAVGFLERAERDIRNTIFKPVRDFSRFIKIMNSTRLTDLGDKINKASFRDAHGISEDADLSFKAAEELRQKIEDTALYASSLAGIDVSPFVRFAGKKEAQLLVNKALVYSEYQAVNALYRLRKEMDKILEESELFEMSQIEAIQNQYESIYNQADASQVKKGNSKVLEAAIAEKSQLLNSGAIKEAKAVDERISEIRRENLKAKNTARAKFGFVKSSRARIVIIEGGQTIEKLAALYLGNVDRFRDIVVLNNLVHPYVDPDKVDEFNPRVRGVLRPGDQCYIPQTGTNTPIASVKRTLKTYPIDDNKSEVEKSFGSDILLDDDFDIIITGPSDMKLVNGSHNVAQSILLRILFEIGSLKRHPGIGTDLGIGQKVSNPKTVLNQIRTSVSSDVRVESIIYSDIKQEGNTSLINLLLKLKGVDQPVTVPVFIPAQG